MPPTIPKANGDTGYFTHLRADILALVPAGARHILSVGCGQGVTEAVLVKRGARVVGVELDRQAACGARARGLAVVEGDAADVDRALAGNRFDCLIYADVLEHIADPLAVLRSHAELLEADGTVIISVPNFRRYDILWQLAVRGHVKYTDRGILDRTHLRITTRRMVEEWCSDAGLQPIKTSFEMGRRRAKAISACSFGTLKEFMAQQVIVVAKKVHAGPCRPSPH